MNDRQLFALTHPLTDPLRDKRLMDQCTSVRRHANGLWVMSILAVDR